MVDRLPPLPPNWGEASASAARRRADQRILTVPTLNLLSWQAGTEEELQAWQRIGIMQVIIVAFKGSEVEAPISNAPKSFADKTIAETFQFSSRTSLDTLI
jgi:hypothetical protein